MPRQINPILKFFPFSSRVLPSALHTLCFHTLLCVLQIPPNSMYIIWLFKLYLMYKTHYESSHYAVLCTLLLKANSPFLLNTLLQYGRILKFSSSGFCSIDQNEVSSVWLCRFCARSQTREKWLLVSACPSTRNNSAPIGRSFKRSLYFSIFRKSVQKKNLGFH